ncbi:MAG TPA: tRNA uridine-5-carboxymethylaminomethyl(34) synthesis GTPase MnmE [Rickettsiales bacterium]|nr:tRNA uridine-5-carboxymethylaminomethyl(34) synthesis GTPase MnmE [Rickettsiales bacterium]
MQTIFAVATPPGKSGVAVIRISGEQAKTALCALGVPQSLTPRIAALASLQHAGEAIDKALVLYFNAPHSFTGEEVAEIHCHGSRATLHKLTQVLASLPGFRLAEPGEFTRRAFLNGKMDLTAAEGLADLIDADTEAQRKQALRVMEGETASFFEALRADILHSLAFLEAYIDFPDEDIPESVLAEVTSEINEVAARISAQLADNRAGEKIREGIYIAILGAPNVGKSSLLNWLAKREAAIVSDIAGTTRDVIEVQLDIKGYPVILADTAGIREQAETIEREGIRRSFERARTADIKLVMLDATQAAAAQNVSTLIDENAIVLWNKVDAAQSPGAALADNIKPIAVSVKERIGLEKLIEAIETKIAASVPPEASFITRSRHRAHLVAALEHLGKYEAARMRALELACEELRRAATEIGKITGRISVDEVLGHIFSSFCIGK